MSLSIYKETTGRDRTEEQVKDGIFDFKQKLQQDLCQLKETAILREQQEKRRKQISKNRKKQIKEEKSYKFDKLAAKVPFLKTICPKGYFKMPIESIEANEEQKDFRVRKANCFPNKVFEKDKWTKTKDIFWKCTNC